jgi:hypothetical protein
MATIAPQIALSNGPPNGSRTHLPRSPWTLPDRAIWDASAPESVRSATDFLTGSDGWLAWAAHLAQRRAPGPLADLPPGKATLLWGSALWGSAPWDSARWGSAKRRSAAADRGGETAAHEVHAPCTAELVVRLDRLSRKKRFDHGPALAAELATWLSAAGDRSTMNRSLECLAWARAMPWLAGIVPAGLWWRLLAELLRAVDDAHDAVETDPLLRQLLGVELPLSLAHQFPEIQLCGGLAGGATAAWERGILGLVDKAGFVMQRNLALVRPLLACWTRVMSVAEELEGTEVSDAVRSRFRHFVRQALRFARRDGSMALSADRPSPADGAMFLAAVDLIERSRRRKADCDEPAGDKSDGRGVENDSSLEKAADRRIAQSIFSGRRLSRKQIQFGGDLPPSSAHGEAAGLAALRPSWSRADEQLWVAYGGSEVRVELAAGRDRLVWGVWTAEIRLGGRPLTPRGHWEEVCWVSDEDVDYLELEIALSEHVRLERQILLTRKDRLLFLADVVLRDDVDVRNGRDATNGKAESHNGKPESLEYRGTLPLGDDVAFDAAGETREGYLVGRKPRAILFPLALPEWRNESCGGSLETTAAGLELRQSQGSARRLYAPLLLDMDTKRMMRPATWRTLTVAENRAIQPPDVAVGYRVQAGKEQWLFYRSLAERGNRTLLGQNLASEFLAARFNRSGETEPLLEIE